MYVKLDTIDLDAGRRELNIGDELAAERAEYAAKPFYKKFYAFFC